MKRNEGRYKVDQISEVSRSFYLIILNKIKAEYRAADRKMTETMIANMAVNVFYYSKRW